MRWTWYEADVVGVVVYASMPPICRRIEYCRQSTSSWRHHPCNDGRYASTGIPKALHRRSAGNGVPLRVAAPVDTWDAPRTKKVPLEPCCRWRGARFVREKGNSADTLLALRNEGDQQMKVMRTSPVNAKEEGGETREKWTKFVCVVWRFGVRSVFWDEKRWATRIMW